MSVLPSRSAQALCIHTLRAATFRRGRLPVFLPQDYQIDICPFAFPAVPFFPLAGRRPQHEPFLMLT